MRQSRLASGYGQLHAFPNVRRSILSGSHMHKQNQGLLSQRHLGEIKSPLAKPTTAQKIAQSSGPEGRHAILHDFCMIIPYSSIIILAGLVSIPFGAGWKGLILSGVGAAELALTIKSLNMFQKQASSMPFTAGSAAVALGLAAHFSRLLKKQTAFWPKAMLSSLAILSFAATAFLVYNILAGGNPPKEDKAVTATESMTPQKAY